jgi:hypothetical protein
VLTMLHEWDPPDLGRWGLVLTLLVVGAERQLDCVRWWRSPRVVAAARVTPAQATTIEHLYDEGEADRRRLTEAMVAAMNGLCQLNDDNSSEDLLLAASQQLSRLAVLQSRLDSSFRSRAAGALSADQIRLLAPDAKPRLENGRSERSRSDGR